MGDVWIGILSGVIVFLVTVGGTLYQFFSLPNSVLDTVQVKAPDKRASSHTLKRYTGAPLIINFWGSWCEPSFKEFRIFRKAHRETDGNLQFVMVSDEPIEQILSVRNQSDLPFKFVKSEQSFPEYGINVRPVTYFYDEGGEQIGKHRGMIKPDTLQSYLDEMKVSV